MWPLATSMEVEVPCVFVDYARLSSLSLGVVQDKNMFPVEGEVTIIRDRIHLVTQYLAEVLSFLLECNGRFLY